MTLPDYDNPNIDLNKDRGWRGWEGWPVSLPPVVLPSAGSQGSAKFLTPGTVTKILSGCRRWSEATSPSQGQPRHDSKEKLEKPSKEKLEKTQQGKAVKTKSLGWWGGECWPDSLPPVAQPVSRQPGGSRSHPLALLRKYWRDAGGVRGHFPHLRNNPGISARKSLKKPSKEKLEKPGCPPPYECGHLFHLFQLLYQSNIALIRTL